MILGIPFMKGYYITHNLDTLVFGIVPQNEYDPVDSENWPNKIAPVAGTQPTKMAARINDNTLYWLWICLGVIGGALLGWGIYEIVRRKKEKKQNMKQTKDYESSFDQAFIAKQ